MVNGAGGVGSILIQLARQMTGLTVVATASRPETVAWCRRMGAHHVIDHQLPLDEEMTRAGLPQADYVASLTATDSHLGAIQRLIAPQGTLALIDDPQALDIVPFKRKSVTIAWELMFTRPLYGTADMARQGAILRAVADMVEEERVRTTATATTALLSPSVLADAHRGVESGRSIGKTVIPFWD